MEYHALGELSDDADSFVSGPSHTPVVCSPAPDRISQLFSVGQLDQLVVSGGLNASALTVANFSRRAPEAQFTMRRHNVEPAIADLCDPLSIAQFLQQGYSLHVSNLQRYSKEVLMFTDRLAFEFGAPVKAEAFMTPPGAQAFAEHYDTNDNFICQMFGTKAWRLYAPSFVSPLPRHPWQWADASDELRHRLTERPPDIEVTLRPGTVLWIPRGWIHAGTATDDASLHVTLRPEPVSLEWVSQRVVEILADRHRSLRRSVGYQSLTTPDRARATLNDTVGQLMALVSDGDAEADPVDLWRSHCGLFAGPVMRPVLDVAVEEAVPQSRLWIRPEAAVGHWRRGQELYVQLGTARKVLDGVEASLIEGVLSSGEYVNVESVADKFATVIDWDKFVPELKAVGLAVREEDIPAHWLDNVRAQST